jgi:ribosomal 50S subunit-recycling heat shock protein
MKLLDDWLVKNRWAKDRAMAKKFILDRAVMKNSGWCDEWTCVNPGDYIYFILAGEGKLVTEFNI